MISRPNYNIIFRWKRRQWQNNCRTEERRVYTFTRDDLLRFTCSSTMGKRILSLPMACGLTKSDHLVAGQPGLPSNLNDLISPAMSSLLGSLTVHLMTLLMRSRVTVLRGLVSSWSATTLAGSSANKRHHHRRRIRSSILPGLLSLTPHTLCTNTHQAPIQSYLDSAYFCSVFTTI